MNAPEHYAQAERLLDAISGPLDPVDTYSPSTMAAMAVAHALLAIGSELGIPPEPHPAMADLSRRRAQAAADVAKQAAQAAAGGSP